MFFKNREGQKIFFRNFISPKAKYNLIILHGINEHSGRYVNLINAFNKTFKQEINIFAYDHRGHGQSQGKKGFINKFTDYGNDLDDFIQYLKNEQSSKNLPLIIFAHSMGGLIALDYVINNKQKIKTQGIQSLIVSAPGLMPSMHIAFWKKLLTPVISIIWPTFSLPTPELGYTGDDLCYDRLTARWFNEFNKARKRVLNNMKSIFLPVLIFHSKQDQLVYMAGSQALYKNISSEKKKLVVLNTTSHAPFDIEAPDSKNICNKIAQESKDFLLKVR